MAKAQVEGTLPPPIIDQEEAIASFKTPPTTISMDHQQPPSPPPVSRYKWWLRVTVFTLFVLSGQAISTLLLRLYFGKGGNSKWLSSLVQIGGFPILIPLIFFFPTQKHNPDQSNNNSPKSPYILVLIYLFLGTLLAANSTLYSLGVANLPVSTFSLIIASALAFNAFFSYFLNAQKFTPLIVNSLVLLTTSSTLLVFQNPQGGTSKISKNKYAIGFVCAVGGAAANGLLLSMTQFAFRKIVKLTTYRVVFDMIIYQSLVASILILIALFASGEWKTLKGEMKGYELGKAPYVMTLVGIAMTAQVFIFGLVGLVFEVSSLFSNVIGALGVPIVPIFAVVFFHEKMSGVKVIAMVLALWGFASYIYQEYLDDSKAETETKHANEVSLTESA